MMMTKQMITDYVSINVKNIYDDYTPGTSYDEDDIVNYGILLYKSVHDSNQGNQPNINPSHWVEWGTNNIYGAIDAESDSTTTFNPSTATDPTDTALEIIFNAARYNIVTVGNVEGASIKIESFITGQTTAYKTFESDVRKRPCVKSWWEYVFGPLADDFSPRTHFFFDPGIQSGTVKVTVEAGSDGVASIGYLMAGCGQDIGCALSGFKIALEDFSRKKRDEYGKVIVTKRNVSEKHEVDVAYDTEKAIGIKNFAKSLMGEAVVTVGDPEENTKFEHLMVLGYLDNFDTVITTKNKTKSNITIREIL